MENDAVRCMFDQAADLLKQCGDRLAETVCAAAQELIDCFERGGKLLVFGNGGSASQAQHFAAEVVNKLFDYRTPLPAIALTADCAVLTSIANDMDYDAVFSRQIEALGQKGDVAWGLSTSGSSANVVQACRAARRLNLKTICFVGGRETILAEAADIILSVPSENTARIQELHLCAGHAVCELVERHWLNRAAAE